MHFPITIFSGRAYTFIVRQISLSDTSEMYQVEGKNKIIIVESNRPLFRAKGLKYRKPTWKLTAGELHNKDFLEKIYSAIMKEVDK